MKRELIITIIIVVIIIIAGILTQENTKKVMSDINGKLEDLKQAVLTDTENEELSKDVDKIYDDWLEKDKILSLYIEHNELEKINTHLKTIKGFLEADEERDSVSEIEKCISVVNHLEEKQAVNIKNIF